MGAGGGGGSLSEVEGFASSELGGLQEGASSAARREAAAHAWRSARWGAVLPGGCGGPENGRME